MSLRAPAGRTAAAGLVSLLLAASGIAHADDVRLAPPLPTEASRWVGEPISWDALRGRVTLVFVWTFG